MSVDVWNDLFNIRGRAEVWCGHLNRGDQPSHLALPQVKPVVSSSQLNHRHVHTQCTSSSPLAASAVAASTCVGAEGPHGLVLSLGPMQHEDLTMSHDASTDGAHAPVSHGVSHGVSLGLLSAPGLPVNGHSGAAVMHGRAADHIMQAGLSAQHSMLDASRAVADVPDLADADPADPYYRPAPSVLDPPSTSRSAVAGHTATRARATGSSGVSNNGRAADSAMSGSSTSQISSKAPHKARHGDFHASTAAAKQLTAQIKACASWQELHMLLADMTASSSSSNGSSRKAGSSSKGRAHVNHVHAAAAITHLAQLCSRATAHSTQRGSQQHTQAQPPRGAAASPPTGLAASIPHHTHHHHHQAHRQQPHPQHQNGVVQGPGAQLEPQLHHTITLSLQLVSLHLPSLTEPRQVANVMWALAKLHPLALHGSAGLAQAGVEEGEATHWYPGYEQGIQSDQAALLSQHWGRVTAGLVAAAESAMTRGGCQPQELSSMVYGMASMGLRWVGGG